MATTTKVNWCWTLSFLGSLRTVSTPVFSTVALKGFAELQGTNSFCTEESALFCHTQGATWVVLGCSNRVLVGNQARNDHVQARVPATHTVIMQDSCFRHHLRNQQTLAGTVQNLWVTRQSTLQHWQSGPRDTLHCSHNKVNILSFISFFSLK